MNNKPSIPQGTRDFPAEVVRKRNYIFSTIRNVFELYGFEPLETPAMENLDTLMGKYGDEGDKLIYRILDSGDPFDSNFFAQLSKYYKSNYDNLNYLIENEEEFKNTQNPFANPLWQLNPEVLSEISHFLKKYKESNKKLVAGVKNEITDKALKYDLTIPFARYVAMNHTKLSFPFRRYQIQPVWRADRPQKGRYREFTQCDADVVGSLSLINEVELANIYHEVFIQLGIKNYELRINSRKILAGVAEAVDASDKMIEIAIAIDKFDKIGLDGVKTELTEKGFTSTQISELTDFIFAAAKRVLPIDVQLQDGEDFTLHFLENASPKYAQNESFRKGVAELKEVLNKVKTSNPESKIQIDLTLARGLNYYTGIIFEAKAPEEVKMGSIGGGGRYDDLTGLFGVPNIPGVGISFGVDRIYDVLEELNLFPENLQVSTKALFFNMGEEESAFAFGIMQKLRSSAIACELYHEPVKINKQFTYAEKKNIPFVIIIGSKEMEEKSCPVKNLSTGKQETVTFENLADHLKNL